MSEIITRFAKAYVALIEVGDIKYFDWSKEVICNIKEASDIGMDKYFEQYKTDIETLESHLKEQQEIITKYRENNPLFNHFTVSQYLILQRYLYDATVDIRHVNKLPKQVFTLLKSIASDVTVVMVKNSIHQSYVKSDTCINDDWKMAETENRSNFTDKSYKQLQDILYQLQKRFRIIENVAYAALYTIYPYDETKALIWCRKQDPDSVKIDDDAELTEIEMKKLKEKVDE